MAKLLENAGIDPKDGQGDEDIFFEVKNTGGESVCTRTFELE